MASARAEGVAEAIFELKRLDKLATFTEIATRAGFKPGAGGRTFVTCLAAVHRDWPYLHWWRAIPDDFLFAEESDHAKELRAAGFEFESLGKRGLLRLIAASDSLFTWEPAIGETTHTTRNQLAVIVDADINPVDLSEFFAELAAIYSELSNGDELIIAEGKLPVRQEVYA